MVIKINLKYPDLLQLFPTLSQYFHGPNFTQELT